jgi:hypothetical protein
MFPLVPLTPVVSSLLGKEALLEGTRAVLGTTKSILSHTCPKIDSIMEELDLKNSIGQIHAIIEDIKNHADRQTQRFFDAVGNNAGSVNTIRTKEDGSVDLYDEFKSLSFAIKSLDEIVKKIDNKLIEIKEELEEHNKKWFSSWRTSNNVDNIHNLLNMKLSMDKRVDNLIKVSQLKTFII